MWSGLVMQCVFTPHALETGTCFCESKCGKVDTAHRERCMTERKTKQQGSPCFHLSRRRQAGSSIKVTQLNSQSIVWRGESESVWLHFLISIHYKILSHSLSFWVIIDLWFLAALAVLYLPLLPVWLTTHCQFGYKEWIFRLEGPSA